MKPPPAIELVPEATFFRDTESLINRSFDHENRHTRAQRHSVVVVVRVYKDRVSRRRNLDRELRKAALR